MSISDRLQVMEHASASLSDILQLAMCILGQLLDLALSKSLEGHDRKSRHLLWTIPTEETGQISSFVPSGCLY